MKTYIIKETCLYQIEANSEDEAEEKFVNAEDLNEYFIGLEEREVYE